MTRNASNEPTGGAQEPDEHPVGAAAGVTEQPPRQEDVTERDVLSTGASGLDRLLRGGLPRGRFYVVRGAPGSGKSVLAHQIGAWVARNGDGSVLYLTALVESHQSLLAQARTLSFFDRDVSQLFYYASLFPALERGGLAAVVDEIAKLVREREPSLLVIDGVHAFKRAAKSELDFQRWVHGLAALAGLGEITLLVLVHLDQEVADPMTTIADGVLEFRSQFVRLRNAKQVMVLKLRGVPHITGWHSYVIGRDGLRVYPRLESVIAAEGLRSTVPEPGAVRFGDTVKGMDELLGGGLTSASITLLPGTAGAGKTNVCLAFLAGGLDENGDGDRGLFLGFHETPDRLLIKADKLKLPLRRGVEAGTIRLEWQPPTEVLGDALIDRLFSLIDRHGIQRLIIDTLDDVRRATLPPERELELFVAMVTALRAKGVTTIIPQDLPRLIGGSFDLPHGGEISPVVDHIIHMRYAEISAELRRLIVVMKLRDRAPDPAIREIVFGDDGISIGRRFPDAQALLSGMPTFRGAHAEDRDGP